MYKYKQVQLPLQFANIIPAHGNVRMLTKEQAKEYFKWFISVQDERIAELTRFINSNIRYASWKPDYTLNSVEGLELWLTETATKRDKTEEEKFAMIEMYMKLGSSLEQALNTKQEGSPLSDETESICFDVGVYLNNLLIKNVNGIRWSQMTDNNKSMDKNVPMLYGFEIPIDMRRATRNTALRAVSQKPQKSLKKCVHDYILQNKTKV